MKKSLKTILSLALCAVLTFSVCTTAVLAADLGALASEFNVAVGAFADTTIIETEVEAIEVAEAKLNAYLAAGGATSDAAIAESYVVFTEKKEKTEALVLACEAFLGYVADAADYNDEGDYPNTRVNLDAATELVSKIRISDPYVSGAYAEYLALVGELRVPEEICEVFVGYAKQAADATSYKDIEYYLSLARSAEKKVTLEGFVGEAEAYANLEKAENAKKGKMAAAVLFIGKVQLIKHGNLDSFRTALAALEGVDLTADGVETAKDKLDSYIDAYNQKVKAANERFAEAIRVADCVM